MRHAKSDWTDDNLSDFDRPLNERGSTEAPKIGKELQKIDIFPDIIYSSPANRAKSTTLIIAEKINYKNEIIYIDNFYFGNYNDVLKTVKSTSDNFENMMIVGHNPTWETLVNRLKTDNNYFEMTTANLVIITFQVEKWQDISEKSGKTQLILKPKDVK